MGLNLHFGTYHYRAVLGTTVEICTAGTYVHHNQYNKIAPYSVAASSKHLQAHTPLYITVLASASSAMRQAERCVEFVNVDRILPRSPKAPKVELRDDPSVLRSGDPDGASVATGCILSAFPDVASSSSRSRDRSIDEKRTSIEPKRSSTLRSSASMRPSSDSTGVLSW